MNAKLRITFALTLGLLTFVGTLLAMGPHPQDVAQQTSAPNAPQTMPEPYLVKDIYSGTTGSSPSGLTAVSGKLFFVADDGTHGKELWKSDGTSDGTILVKDIYTGSGPSSINNLAGVNGTLFFNADDGVYGLELWKSDGATNGTVMVKDIRTGSWGSQNPSTAWFARVGNTLFFVAAEPTYGEELWKSDGTSEGTILVKDIYPGGFPFDNSTPDWLTEMNGLLFFTADDGSHGRQPWKSDGTPTATLMISNVNASGGDPPSWLTNVDGTLFFDAFTGSGYALCKSDGTLTGTSVITDLGGSPPGGLTNVNGILFLQAYGQLWKSDGTPTGTVMVTNIYPYFPINVNGTLFFAADDGSSGLELWKSDGTLEGTVMVRDINPGSGSSLPSPARFSNINGTLYFGASDGSHGTELWKSDGTFTGTVMVADINPGSGSSSPYRFTLSGTTLFFVANDGSHGQELWALSVTPLATLAVTKQASPDPVQAGSQLTYTLRVTNTGSADLHAIITDTLPSHITSGRTSGGTLILPGRIITWTPVITGPGGIWVETMVVTVEMGYAGPLTNVVQVTTLEGASGIYTATSQALVTPALLMAKNANPDPVQAGSQLTYTLRLTNTGNIALNGVITDTLPLHVTPTGSQTWALTDLAPGHVWTQQVVVTVTRSYSGTLTNRVQVTTLEGATGEAQVTTNAVGYQIYLPLVLKS